MIKKFFNYNRKDIVDLIEKENHAYDIVLSDRKKRLYFDIETKEGTITDQDMMDFSTEICNLYND